MSKKKFTAIQLSLAASMIFTFAVMTITIRAQSAEKVENDFYSISASPTFSADKTKFSFVSLAVVNVTNIEELYAAVNNSANAGNQIVLAAGVYLLSVNDPNGAARPNSGRLELQENMSLRGVVGDRGAVVIDANNLPSSSYSAPPISLTAAIRMGRGTNSIEWLTARNAVNGSANIGTELASTATNIRVAHVASSNSQRGLDVRNFGAAQTGRTINAEIIDNDFYNNRIASGESIRIANNQIANGAVMNVTLAGNRSYNNYQGFIVNNNQSSNAVTTVFSSGNRFFENAVGGVILSVSAGSNVANGNTISFTGYGDVFENNNGFNGSGFGDLGGLVIIGGENISFPNGTSNNTVNVELRNCRFSNNQLHDLAAFGARSNPASVGMPGTNNRVKMRLIGTLVPVFETADSVPANPAWMNSVTVIRSPVTSNFDYDGDGRADLSVFRPSDRIWYLNRSQAGFSAFQFGLSTDKITPADYDGDGKTDIAVYRAGIWYLQRSQLGFLGFAFGLAEDIPQPADYDGDGKTDIAVWRPSNGVWYVFNLATNQFTSFQFGGLGDKPAVGDYDGDGRADFALLIPDDLQYFYVHLSSTGENIPSPRLGFGDTDYPVPADYDGDGKTDFAVVSPTPQANWYIRRSSSGGSLQVVSWGLGMTDLLLKPADYDGDGKADVAVYRNGVWWIRQSASGVAIQQFGLSSDLPTNQIQ